MQQQGKYCLYIVHFTYNHINPGRGKWRGGGVISFQSHKIPMAIYFWHFVTNINKDDNIHKQNRNWWTNTQGDF